LTDFSFQYGSLADENLVQLWSERAQMVPEAKTALWEEIERRHIAEQAHTYVPPQEVVRKLAPPVNTYFNITVLYWWLREIWLRIQCSHGTLQPARVDSTRQTQPAYRSAARAELCYSYEFEGQRYSGRAVRDFMFNGGAADRLAFGHKHGEAISVHLDPKDPSRSFYPSGFGWIEPLIVGSMAVLVWFVLLLMLVFTLFPKVKF
jgi:hypothetical protein